MRPENKPDVPLGKDRELAIAKWEELHLGRPRIRGRIREAIQHWTCDELPTYANEGTRRNYKMHLNRVDAVFGMMTWDQVTLLMLKQYLKNRRNATDPTKPAGVQANREMAAFQIVWNWARQTAPEGRNEAYTALPWPAAGMERSRWKNPEQAREFEVTDELFGAVYVHACQFLKDTMDLSSATGMRLTDCIKVVLPKDDVLRLKANKTGKKADFDLSLSEVLPQLLARRRGYDANHLMLVSTPDGFPVHLKDLRREWDKARAKAAAKARAAGTPEGEALAKEIEAMWLRDMRKYAADLAEDAEAASKLLQHSSVALTKRHYRTKGDTLKTTR
nr:integrase [Ramlibacter monticola]